MSPTDKPVRKLAGDPDLCDELGLTAGPCPQCGHSPGVHNETGCLLCAINARYPNIGRAFTGRHRRR
jgi:hypothetical protein